MDNDEKLRTDYDQTSNYFFHLADVRFKLLALVPVAAGIAVGLLGKDDSAGTALVVGIFGFLVTLGVAMYDQRNTQIYDAMVKRLKGLEARFGFKSLQDGNEYGGAFTDRPKRSRTLFGVLMWHDRALAIVYSAALAAWAYLIVHALLNVLRVFPAAIVVFFKISLPAVIFLTFLRALQKYDEPTDEYRPKRS